MPFEVLEAIKRDGRGLVRARGVCGGVCGRGHGRDGLRASAHE